MNSVTTESPEDGHSDDEAADDPTEEPVDTSHLDDLDDGCGCAEVWDHLSDQRDD